MAAELLKGKWYSTRTAKVFGVLAVATAFVVLVIRHFRKDDTTTSSISTTTPTAKQLPDGATTEPTTEQQQQLPGSVCGTMITSFDRTSNYVKCDGIWYTVSKDGISVPAWKSLADNKTATDLLNNKYPN